jgi:hypothetical protein
LEIASPAGDEGRVRVHVADNAAARVQCGPLPRGQLDEQDLAREESNAAESDHRATNRVAQGAPEELRVPRSTEEPSAVLEVSQTEINNLEESTG